MPRMTASTSFKDYLKQTQSPTALGGLLRPPSLADALLGTYNSSGQMPTNNEADYEIKRELIDFNVSWGGLQSDFKRGLL